MPYFSFSLFLFFIFKNRKQIKQYLHHVYAVGILARHGSSASLPGSPESTTVARGLISVSFLNSASVREGIAKSSVVHKYVFFFLCSFSLHVLSNFQNLAYQQLKWSGYYKGRVVIGQSEFCRFPSLQMFTVSSYIIYVQL